MKLFLMFACLVAVTPYGELHSDDLHARILRKPLGRSMVDDLAGNRVTPAGEDNKEYWLDLAREELTRRVQRTLNTHKAKNVIFFLGDGMSVSTVTASRIRKGQLKGNNGEEDHLSFEKFPSTALSKTYCVDGQVADSACTSMAYLGGYDDYAASV